MAMFFIITTLSFQLESTENEVQRKRERPQSLTELMEVTKVAVDDIVSLYPGGFARMKFRVLSLSPRDLRLQLVDPPPASLFHPFGYRIYKSRASVKRNTTHIIDVGFGLSWDIGYHYFDGGTMGIVFGEAVTIEEDEGLYINLPTGCTIDNIDEYGTYLVHELDGLSLAILLEPGTYSRGPRPRSDHT
jgi:hypothetical protein